MPWAAVAGAVVGGAFAASNAEDAEDAQHEATQQAGVRNNDAIAEQRRQFDLTRGDAQQTRDDFADWRTAGRNALGQLQTDISTPVSAADVMSDPGYQFGLQQGQLGLDRKASAMGGRVSGAALKAASQYATNYAASGYGAAYQRKQDRLNRLASLAGLGQTATGASAMAGAGAGQTNAITGVMGNQANLISAQGNATAAGQLAQGNIWGNAANQIAAAGQRWASTPTQYSGFNSVNGGYTNIDPTLVGPPG